MEGTLEVKNWIPYKLLKKFQSSHQYVLRNLNGLARSNTGKWLVHKIDERLFIWGRKKKIKWAARRDLVDFRSN